MPLLTERDQRAFEFYKHFTPIGVRSGRKYVQPLSRKLPQLIWNRICSFGDFPLLLCILWFALTEITTEYTETRKDTERT